MDFESKRVNSRVNALSFVQKAYKGNLLEDIGRNPERWIEELRIIYEMLEGIPLVGGVNLFMPPLEDKDFIKIGENVFFYCGDARGARGLWISKEVKDYSKGINPDEKMTEWTHYGLGTKAVLKINPKYSDVGFEKLMPDNFEKDGELIKKDKRQIIKFEICHNDRKENVYAKQSQIITSFYYEKPIYRLTDIAGLTKISSAGELEKTLNLQEGGVNVPEIVGMYTSDFEDFLFLKEVEDKTLEELDRFSPEIIRQDAEMLAKLCKTGYRKTGFEDFDDKIFDGEKLYLIDVDEVNDLYGHEDIDFKNIVLDTTGKGIKAFRNYQSSLFKRMLKDALYRYKENMLKEAELIRQYIGAFYKEMGWTVTDKDMEYLTIYGNNYQTYDSIIAMMHDTD